ALADVRAGKNMKEPEKKEEIHAKVPEGKTLKPGMKDERVAAVRQRLNIEGDKTSNLYDDAVAKAVKQFQKDNGLGTDGNLGPNTVKAMNGQKHEAAAKLGDPVDTILVNLDRWRWYNHDLGDRYVVVNIPDFRLSLYDQKKV